MAPKDPDRDWKVHWAVNLADLQCDFFGLTDVEKGRETFRRVPVTAGDILMGDRVYAAPPGVSNVVKARGDVVVRLNRQALPLFERGDQRIDLLPFLRGMKGKTAQEREEVRSPHGGWIPGRLVSLRQSAEATRWAQRRLRRWAQRNHERVSAESLRFAEYFTVWTTLSRAFAATPVLEFYRLHWQIELVFKRMKSILGLGHLPKQGPPERESLARRQAVHGTTDRAHGSYCRIHFPLGLRFRSLVAADGGRLSLCIVKCALLFCCPKAWQPCCTNGKRLAACWQSHPESAAGAAYLRLTLVRHCPGLWWIGLSGLELGLVRDFDGTLSLNLWLLFVWHVRIQMPS